jgi:alpha-glucuronidase
MTDGSLVPTLRSAIAGVANIGEDVNWCGHHFAQANWYAFGRQAWDHELDSEKIADEWIRMTFTGDPGFLGSVKTMMLDSREAVVHYMMPLGLHHLFAWTHHYGPEPWCDIPGARPDWLPRYYHNASARGIGFDRTRSGSAAVDQYHPPLNDLYNDINTCPEELLLWFHFTPWDHVMKSGRTLWDELSYTYQQGVDEVREFQKTWDRMEAFVDHERFSHVQSRLRIQARDAVWWRDACLLYFQTYSKLPIPYELERPIHDLEDLKKIKLDMKHHN